MLMMLNPSQVSHMETHSAHLPLNDDVTFFQLSRSSLIFHGMVTMFSLGCSFTGTVILELESKGEGTT